MRGIKTILILLGVFVLLSIFSLNLVIIYGDLEKRDQMEIKTVAYWDLSPIVIDNEHPTKNWIITATTYDWCNGSGTSTDPYIIEYLSINGQDSANCLEIRNSEVYFVIRNCKFYNGNFASNHAGIKLTNTDM